MSKLPIPFKKWTTYPGHGGIDFPQPRGTVIRASGPGVVYHRNKTLRGGYQIWVKYDSGVKVGHAHMDSFSGCPEVGTRVVEGTQLGRVGSKGLFSTGPHLHIEISGQATSAAVWKYFDPNRVVGQSGGSTAAASKTPSTPTASKEQIMVIFIKGRVGVRNGGVYVEKDGKLNFIGSANPGNIPVFTDENQISALVKLYPFA